MWLKLRREVETSEEKWVLLVSFVNEGSLSLCLNWRGCLLRKT